MISVKELAKYLTSLLAMKEIDTARVDPSMANGLVIEGTNEVKKIGFGVSASLRLFERAKETSCDVLVVHHSLNFPSASTYDSLFQKRIGFLIKNNLSLFGYHFLLDAHKEFGNNVQILNIIGAKPSYPYRYRGDPWGWIGFFEKRKTLRSIVTSMKAYMSRRTVIYPFKSKNITRVVALSGKGAPYAGSMQELLDQEIDLYITGEVHEWNRELFREAGISMIAGGHYATETLGIKSLMEKVGREFSGMEVVWLDVPNDV
ncbi:Nif3-like dinuclear metal center hexameric protein [Candidatus Gottesmanbacteria bacterium]|nr:Nif3-like dinuclear metal center hexameric protein [Candidatus Gottesmanbacteria bacterium]